MVRSIVAGFRTKASFVQYIFRRFDTAVKFIVKLLMIFTCYGYYGILKVRLSNKIGMELKVWVGYFFTKNLMTVI